MTLINLSPNHNFYMTTKSPLFCIGQQIWISNDNRSDYPALIVDIIPAGFRGYPEPHYVLEVPNPIEEYLTLRSKSAVWMEERYPEQNKKLHDAYYNRDLLNLPTSDQIENTTNWKDLLYDDTFASYSKLCTELIQRMTNFAQVYGKDKISFVGLDEQKIIPLNLAAALRYAYAYHSNDIAWKNAYDIAYRLLAKTEDDPKSILVGLDKPYLDENDAWW